MLGGFGLPSGGGGTVDQVARDAAAAATGWRGCVRRQSVAQAVHAAVRLTNMNLYRVSPDFSAVNPAIDNYITIPDGVSLVRVRNLRVTLSTSFVMASWIKQERAGLLVLDRISIVSSVATRLFGASDPVEVQAGDKFSMFAESGGAMSTAVVTAYDTSWFEVEVLA